jgi:hypothetical protein
MQVAYLGCQSDTKNFGWILFEVRIANRWEIWICLIADIIFKEEFQVIDVPVRVTCRPSWRKIVISKDNISTVTNTAYGANTLLVECRNKLKTTHLMMIKW